MWELRENLENAQELVNQFKEDYSEEVRQIKKKNTKEDKEKELPGRYMAKLLYEWNDKRFDREY